MALKKADQKNFHTLCEAMARGDVAIMETRCVKTGEYRAIICMMNKTSEGMLPVPVAQMVLGNPYEEYVDPTMTELPAATDATSGSVH